MLQATSISETIEVTEILGEEFAKLARDVIVPDRHALRGRQVNCRLHAQVNYDQKLTMHAQVDC